MTPWDRYLHADSTPMPDWLTSLRTPQVDAVEEIVDQFASGADVVMLDAPTGAGKTLIAELVRRRMPDAKPWDKSLYVCNTIGLQEQFLRDYPYAKLIKGRSNYLPLEPMLPDYTCADCLGAECDWCLDINDTRQCPYDIASRAAEAARIAVTNTSYFITAANYAHKFQGRSLIIADECDTLEGILTNFIEFRVGYKVLKKLGLSAPRKGSHFTTVQEWVGTTLQPALKMAVSTINRESVEGLREFRDLSTLHQACGKFLQTEGDWIRDNDAGPLVYRPITVGPWGEQTLWQHGKKWLCMSGSIVSMREQVTSLGAGALDVRLATVPMSFPVENRPIIIAPVADMKYSNQDEAWPQMATAISNILRREEHHGQRVLVHCVSYALATYLGMNVDAGRRSVVTYQSSQGRDMAFEAYKNSPDGVLFAPSMDRGFDFKEDLARVVIIAKIPFMSLGDKQVSARLREPGGQEWYNVQAVRTILQMTGRGVRSDTDTCTTYILDAQFNSTLWTKAKSLFPQWWRDAMVRNFNWRALRNPVENLVDDRQAVV